jgi:GNAT superfamily N-acetyltransferase
MPDTQVRIATRRDEDELLHSVKIFHREEGLAPIDEDAVRGVLRGALEGDGVVGVIGEPGKVQSSIHLVMGRLWYTSDRSLESLWTVTLPEYRKSQNTKALIAFAKRQAEKLNVPLLLDVASTEDSMRKVGLYERMLGTRAGAVFHYEPNSEKPTELDEPMRTASSADEDEIISICRELHAENGSFPANDDLAIPVLRDCLSGNGVIGVVGEPGKVEGVIFLRIAKMWYSGEPLVEEFFAYVRPEYRSSNNAKNLIAFAKRQADRLNVPLRMCIVSRIATEQKIKLYQRLLGFPKGAFFLYRPNQEMIKAA